MRSSVACIKGLALILGAAVLLLQPNWSPAVRAQEGDNPGPPARPVKLVFIHHSTGENWLRDDYGTLGRTLDAANYFVSDTNYGWGPGGIGDTTDIIDWPKWFGPQRSEEVLKALFNESAQNSAYTRTLKDPGGENEIILFKSCFPNSELGGSPGDPPAPGSYELTVGSAKAIYIGLLDYFASRPDKMFVMVTAPPVSSPENAANARAFNNWLMTQWLAGYPGRNVFVFDFYNVLTDPANHHRYRNDAVEYSNNAGNDTSYYPSGDGDDHPNEAGSRKATDEFVPLLNVFYHRWKANAPPVVPSPPKPAEQPAAPAVTPIPVASTADGSTAIDTFDTEGELPESFNDENGSSITCARDAEQAYGGLNALKMDYEVKEGGYAGCGRYYGEAQDWSRAAGLSMWVRMDGAGELPLLTVHCGSPQGSAPFQVKLKAGTADAQGWAGVYVPWGDLVRAPWADAAGPPEFDPSAVMGYDLGYSAESGPFEGFLWLDEISLAGVDSEIPVPPAVPVTPQGETEPEAGPALPAPPDVVEQEPAAGSPLFSRFPFCSSAAFPLLFLALFMFLLRL